MDTELVLRAQRGDQQAFATLANDTYDRLHHVAYRILRDRHSAEDATQQAALNIWRDLPQLRDPARFEAWSYRLLLNACHGEARRGRRREPEVDSTLMSDPAEPDAFDVIADRDLLERGFRRLSVDHRAVVVLHHYVGLPIHEVAEALDIKVGTAKSRLNRAMAQLRMALEADRPEPRPAPPEVAT